MLKCLVALRVKKLSLLGLGNIYVSMYKTFFFFFHAILFCILVKFVVYFYAHVRHMRHRIIIIVNIAVVFLVLKKHTREKNHEQHHLDLDIEHDDDVNNDFAFWKYKA